MTRKPRPASRRNFRDLDGVGPLPAPTVHLPGTPEKVEILRMRARLRQQLWNPLDARATEAGGDGVTVQELDDGTERVRPAWQTLGEDGRAALLVG